MATRHSPNTRAAAWFLGLSFLGGAHASAQEGNPERVEPAVASEPREVFPHIRLDRERGLIELDGFVPIDCHDPRTPEVFLEVIVCAVDSREHEALVATHARGSHLHAALLALGLEPGSVAGWNEAEPVPPTGPSVKIELVVPDHPDLPTDPRDWIRSVKNDQTLSAWEAERKTSSSWVFAGSEMVQRQGREVYAADGTGQLIGMHTFGSEVIAWSTVLDHRADVQTPEWIADARVVPKVRTPVIVRILRIEEPDQKPEPQVTSD